MDKEAGPKIDWLNEGDDLGKTPEERAYLNHLQELENEGHDVDPLAPFLMKEYRAGNLRGPFQNNNGETDYGLSPYNTLRQALPRWSDWYRSRAHNRPGANLMSPDFTVHSLQGKYEDWYDEHTRDAPEIYSYPDLDDADEWYNNQDTNEALPRTRPKELENNDQGDRDDPYYSWDDLLQSFAPGHRPYQPDWYDPDIGERVYQHARDHGYIPELGEAYKNWNNTAVTNWHDYSYEGPDYTPSAEELGLEREPEEGGFQTREEYEQALAQHTRELENAREEWETDYRDDVFNQSPVGEMMDHYNSLLAPHAVTNPDDGHTRYFNEPPQAPGQQQQQVVGSTGRDPRYFRWVFHPQDAKVTLDHNETDHPAYVKTHRDLAREAPGPNPTHGYAYKIHGGWRLTNYEHKPVEDPFMVAQIIQALRGHKTRPGRKSSAWERVEPDFERLRYGQPLEDS